MPTATQLRSDVGTLVDQARVDLDVLWREARTPRQVESALRDVLPALVDEYGAAVATVAAEWYEDLRLEAGVAGRFTAIPAEIRQPGTQGLVGWAAMEARDMTSFQTLVLGGTQRRIANFSRQTVMGSSVADPRADGWQRISRGRCTQGFCDMLAARGAVYSESTADFAAHDNCQCVAQPAFKGAPRPVKPFTPTLRNVSEADKARTRAYLASH